MLQQVRSVTVKELIYIISILIFIQLIQGIQDFIFINSQYLMDQINLIEIFIIIMNYFGFNRKPAKEAQDDEDAKLNDKKDGIIF